MRFALPTVSGKFAIALSLCLGLLCGALLHYALFRAGLPVRAFIYQAF